VKESHQKSFEPLKEMVWPEGGRAGKKGDEEKQKREEKRREGKKGSRRREEIESLCLSFGLSSLSLTSHSVAEDESVGVAYRRVEECRAEEVQRELR
jgi:hypothetical protein